MSDRRLGIVAAATLLAIGLTGCGSDETPPAATTDPAPTTGTPTTSAPTSDASRRLTGVISRAPEERCTVLATGGAPAAWVLIGAVSSVQDGDRVTVVGREDPGATTRCQQGPVFVVAEVVSD